MKQDILRSINISALDLLNANSTKQLESAIVESAIRLIGADHGQLFLYINDRFKKAYSSSAVIKKNLLIKNSFFKPYLQIDHTELINAAKINKWNIVGLPNNISSIIVVPLIHKKDFTGIIVLYRVSPKLITNDDFDALRLFSKTAVLAITKSRLQDESKRALEIRDRFISLASHELRTPLTSLHGYIQLLHARMADKGTVEARWVKELFIESNRLTMLVKELLDVNRIKQGQFAFVFSEVPMKVVVEKAIEHSRLLNGDHQIIFQNKLKDENVKVVGDIDKLVEMVSGLLGNAVKFSKPEDKIIVSLKVSQGLLYLNVRDSGKGISKKDLTAIFEGFYKSASGNHLEGMGVGLLLAKHIVDNHRGKIKITSKENKGTKVEVILPTIKTSSV